MLHLIKAHKFSCTHTEELDLESIMFNLFWWFAFRYIWCGAKFFCLTETLNKSKTRQNKVVNWNGSKGLGSFTWLRDKVVKILHLYDISLTTLYYSRYWRFIHFHLKTYVSYVTQSFLMMNIILFRIFIVNCKVIGNVLYLMHAHCLQAYTDSHSKGREVVLYTSRKPSKGIMHADKEELCGAQIGVW